MKNKFLYTLCLVSIFFANPIFADCASKQFTSHDVMGNYILGNGIVPAAKVGTRDYIPVISKQGELCRARISCHDHAWHTDEISLYNCNQLNDEYTHCPERRYDANSLGGWTPDGGYQYVDEGHFGDEPYFYASAGHRRTRVNLWCYFGKWNMEFIPQ